MKPVPNIKIIKKNKPIRLKIIELGVVLAKGEPYLCVYKDPTISTSFWIGVLLIDGNIFLYLKVDQAKLLDYLHDSIILQELISTCKDNFYYEDRRAEHLTTYLVEKEKLVEYIAKGYDLKIMSHPEDVNSNLSDIIRAVLDPYNEEIWEN
jgi:cellulose biosynthesis protein BcsQ